MRGYLEGKKADMLADEGKILEDELERLEQQHATLKNTKSDISRSRDPLT